MRSVKSCEAVSGECARERSLCAMWGLGVVIFSEFLPVQWGGYVEGLFDGGMEWWFGGGGDDVMVLEIWWLSVPDKITC